MKFSIAFFFLAWVATSAAGCGGHKDRPELGKVQGTVTLDGTPLPGVLVAFYPETGRCSGGYTDDKGHYELVYLRDVKGAKLGVHRVMITEDNDPAGGTPRRGKSMIGPQYNTNTTLAAKVEPGENTFDFSLTSDGKK
ncbi:hypothetical protein [Planctomicrobium sp. SH664]|uniref:hypothetical protein n=1 Tax=Planctomicrobium sp. SH664 TaxID=3448125 RepID=UPI003F5BDFC0